MVEVCRLQVDDISSYFEPLVKLLQQVVEEGASVGFLPPLAADEARAYWDDVWEDVSTGHTVLLIAHEDENVLGTGQLALEWRPNGRHRAEVRKMMVRADMRRHGVGGLLMTALENEARREGRTLLVLDTRRGDPAEKLYQKWGYTASGVIPQYSRDADGELHDTVFYYKLLDDAVNVAVPADSSAEPAEPGM